MGVAASTNGRGKRRPYTAQCDLSYPPNLFGGFSSLPWKTNRHASKLPF
ncbi:MAG: hypothetical protein H7308_10240 [Chthonomonadaceae bacterium]|nr:hypothetical protein [Chthonomonadaceae bacterium]